MLLDTILDEWDQDSSIDDNHLDISSLKTSIIHSKYVRYLSHAKLKHSALNNEYNTLRQVKFRYYRGELSREELSQYGWFQWQGVKPIKSEIEELLTGDKDLNKLKAKIDYTKTMIDALEMILKEISNRHWAIRNSIEYKKFMSGM
jgi:hypothetical protein